MEEQKEDLNLEKTAENTSAPEQQPQQPAVEEPAVEETVVQEPDVVNDQKPEKKTVEVVVEKKPKNRMATAGMILAIVGLVLCWVPILNIILVLLGFIFSLIGVFRKPRGKAIAGLVISGLTAIAMAIVIIVSLVSYMDAKDKWNDYSFDTEWVEPNDIEDMEEAIDVFTEEVGQSLDEVLEDIIDELDEMEETE